MAPKPFEAAKRNLGVLQAVGGDGCVGQHVDMTPEHRHQPVPQFLPFFSQSNVN
jgi:hypothetical protein